jgi:hypothetical protein
MLVGGQVHGPCRHAAQSPATQRRAFRFRGLHLFRDQQNRDGDGGSAIVGGAAASAASGARGLPGARQLPAHLEHGELRACRAIYAPLQENTGKCMGKVGLSKI